MRQREARKCDKPASPCRCRRARRSARHAGRGRRDRSRASPLRPLHARTDPWSRRGCGASLATSPSHRRHRSCRPLLRQRAARSRDRSACRRSSQIASADRFARLRWRRSARNAPVLPPPIGDRRREASGGSRALPPRSDRPSRRRAGCWRAPGLARAGTSRMSVSSGRVSPMVNFSSRRIIRASTWPSAP